MKLSSGIVSQEIHEAKIKQNANEKAIYFKRYSVLCLFILIGSYLIFVFVFLRFNLFELTHEPILCNGFTPEGIYNSVARRWRCRRVGFSELFHCQGCLGHHVSEFVPKAMSSPEKQVQGKS